MKIGIYKPFKKVCFKKNDEDHAGWSFEVVSLAKILAAKHTVDILSDTDLLPGEIDNITPMRLYKLLSTTRYDRIFIFCGTMNEYEQKNIEMCRRMTKQLDFIFTDFKLKPHSFDIFDNIYTQSKNVYTYAALEKLVLYGRSFKDIQHIKNKDIMLYFGGTERNRLHDLIEYVWRPDVTWHGKSQFLNFNKYISYDENDKFMQRSKYGIVIADIEYNEIGWATPRYFENIMNDMICFMDAKCDKDNLLMRNSDFRRVRSYKEMIEKITILENNPVDKIALIKRQRAEIKNEYLDGSHIYSYLFNEKS